MNLHEGRSIYRKKDFNEDKKGTPALPILGASNAQIWRSALDWNENYQHGIFWTVNEFQSSESRRQENIKKILAWTADIDVGTKAEQSKLVEKYPSPTAVVETKRGFQIYYAANNGTVENYKLIQTQFVVPSLGGDMNARDMSRILRVPCFYHWKDPTDPFFCKLVHYQDVSYTEAQIMAAFKDHREPEKEEREAKRTIQKALSSTGDGGVFDRIWNLDCELALMRLSGTEAVSYEKYDFKNNSNGKMNLIVNDLGTSCFIDAQGRIGSLDGGGPTIWNWLYWFHKDHKRVYKLMKQYFPELFK